MDNIIIDCEDLFQKQIASSMGLNKYAQIIEAVNIVDVSQNREFQLLFNGFYRVRRNAIWRKEYYSLFEEFKKTKNVTFENILYSLFEKTSNIEPSFASKMLATLNVEQPIWDKYVVQKLEVKVPSQNLSKEDRLKQIVLSYNEIENKYRTYLETNNAQDAISLFDKYLPDYKWISDIKKIDAFLWSIR